jgi:hypothetical protein
MLTRGGQNKKSIEQHIADGTYRADRHGLKKEDDSEVLAKMKFALYSKFLKLDKALDGSEIPDKEAISYYLSVIKTFDAISKNPAQPKDGGKPDRMEL